MAFALSPVNFLKCLTKVGFNSLRVGERVELRGKAVFYRNRLEFHHPQIFPAGSEENTVEKDLVLALYSEIEQISQKINTRHPAGDF